jgi:hypothetical protein
MAAFLKFAPTHGVSTTAEAIVRMDNAVRATLRRQAPVRPTLICRWMQGADGRLSCNWECAHWECAHWECDPTGNIPIPTPPH